MQDLSVSSGVESSAAGDICAQYGARLVSSSSLAERQDLLDLVRERQREREEDDCSSHPGGLAFWLRPGGGKCEVWLTDSTDSSDLALPGQFTLVEADCEAVFSTTIGRGLTRLGSHWSRASECCLRQQSYAIKNQIGILRQSLVLYVIRIVTS